MALTLTADTLRNALRLGDTAAETAEVERLLGFAGSAVTKHAPGAPDIAHNEAAIRVAGYLADMPNAGRGSGYADALRNSGAMAILAPYRVHRARSTGPATATTPAAPAGLRQVGSEAVTVTVANRWVRTGLPYPGGDIFGVKVDGNPIALGLTADLPDAGVVAGGDASAAIGAHVFALGADRAIIADRAGGTVFFAAATVGTYTVRLFDHA